MSDVPAQVEKKAELALPASLIGHVDLNRLIREVEDVDSSLQAQKVRNPNEEPHLPSMSQGLRDFLDQNNIDLKDGQALMSLKEHLRVLKDHAPIMHMTFATSAEPETLQKIIVWLRQEVHPHALLSVGLQPNLVGGTYIRTPNHVHDFSLRALLKDKGNGIIAAKLEEIRAR